MSLLVLSMLLLHPVLDEPADVRIVASGVGDAEVVWSLDGHPVAVTTDREAVTIAIAAGMHELQASTTARGAWEIMARPEPRDPSGAQYVPAWTARHVPLEVVRDDAVPAWLWSIPVLGVAVGIGAWPHLRPRIAGAATRWSVGLRHIRWPWRSSHQ